MVSLVGGLIREYRTIRAYGETTWRGVGTYRDLNVLFSTCKRGGISRNSLYCMSWTMARLLSLFLNRKEPTSSKLMRQRTVWCDLRDEHSLQKAA